MTDDTPDYNRPIEKTKPKPNGLLDRLGFPESGWRLQLLTAALVLIQSSAYLLVLTPLPGMKSDGVLSGIYIGIYTLPLIFVTMITAGSVRRTSQSTSRIWSIIGFAGTLVVIAAAASSIGKSGTLTRAASIYVAIWTIATAFSLKPSLDRLLDLAQPRSG